MKTSWEKKVQKKKELSTLVYLNVFKTASRAEENIFTSTN